MLIRPLLSVDQPAYAALWHAMLTDQGDCFRIALEDEPEPRIPTSYTASSFTLGAFDPHGELLGSVSLERNKQTKLRHKALLFRMAVHRAAAGQGVGKTLLQQALTSAAQVPGLHHIMLTVLANNSRAIRLYTSAGFRLSGSEPDSVNINGKLIEELHMTYHLARTPGNQTAF